MVSGTSFLRDNGLPRVKVTAVNGLARLCTWKIGRYESLPESRSKQMPEISGPFLRKSHMGLYMPRWGKHSAQSLEILRLTDGVSFTDERQSPQNTLTITRHEYHQVRPSRFYLFQ